MRSADIVEGRYYRNALGAVYQVADLVLARPKRVRWKLVYATKTFANSSVNAPAVGTTGVSTLASFAARMVSRATRRCKHCRCTDDRACLGGCRWLSWNVCSQCTPAAREADAAFERLEYAL